MQTRLLCVRNMFHLNRTYTGHVPKYAFLLDFSEVVYYTYYSEVFIYFKDRIVKVKHGLPLWRVCLKESVAQYLLSVKECHTEHHWTL